MIVQDNHIAGTGLALLMMDFSMKNCGVAAITQRKNNLYLLKNQQRFVIV
ncbi:TPA: hypothetical protein PCH53_000575 [Klebsiella pneumoniae]|nr:hypothetical protein [Klebsiella pneumoniae]EIV5326746.1 hypothetical protein [Klebsiella pneumoniae]EKO2850435.1 hypothetical protein [Klebsiella pneumoniae]MCJ2636447.1 hypothetical protein [Klebsiella pneumoniae]HBQ1383053.1 hypothetical protein [Klebsiella pneumoniae]HBU8336147.1 hypothetical protein [Klebsiella pneumoniae]